MKKMIKSNKKMRNKIWNQIKLNQTPKEIIKIIIKRIKNNNKKNEDQIE
jgi:hypothetical protein